jgi:hypothetical protein
MNRNHPCKDSNSLTHSELAIRTAIHEAGHAVAIYFGNIHKQLPPVFFQILISSSDADKSLVEMSGDEYFIAKIDGGRLIEILPDSFDEACDNLSVLQKIEFQRAIEADIFNFMAGPLAEANYIALRDNEIINPRLVHLQALYNYGGAIDIDCISDYLDCFALDQQQREQKLTELFFLAFQFIVNPVNWHAIVALADCILTDNKYIVEYQELATILENPVAYGKLTGFGL